ncbi:MAG: SRPBCC domain-containing protein [Candidatus Eisenbacteria bacterium]|nr:SRPBCC domain-containing protein [Candidatus Eisenbacteria bacterium]
MTPKKRIQFTTLIGARPEAVWNTMLGPGSYRDWTASFEEGSYYEGSFDQGGKIRFLTPGGRGMVARIATSRPPAYLSIEHLGFVQDGIEDTTSDAVRAWAPVFENYSFREVDGATELVVELDVTADFEDYMQERWPKALVRLKELCETPDA